MERIDEAIIKRINVGDEKAFAKLYEGYYVYLNTIALYYVNDKNVSREVVNDVFCQVWNKRGTLTYPIRPYLVRSVQNGCIDSLRSQQSLSRTLEDYRAQLTLSYQEYYIRSTPQPLQYVELHQTEKEIQKALTQLPPRCQHIFMVYFYEGKTVEEIAEEMEITISTVRVQLKNSFDRLRDLLGHLLLFFV